MKRPAVPARVLLAGVLSWTLAACGLSTLFPPSSPSTPGDPALQQGYTTGDYKIGPEDVVEVIVWKSPDLSKVVSVLPDGKISLPLVGEVQAVGRTAAQLKTEIEARLKEFKETPNVSVVVQQVNSYSVYVLGEVAHAGKLQLKAYTTVLQAISVAGGFTQFASKNRIFVLRKSPATGAETRINISYDGIVSGADSAQNIVLIPGDTVVVP